MFRLKKRAIEVRDENIARQLLDKERRKVEQFSPQRPPPQNPPRRHAAPMPLPNPEPPRDDLYTEPYKAPTTTTTIDNLQEKLNRIDIAEIGVPIDEVIERQIQEIKDAELARKLQEQENQSEPTQMDRDRMLAIEAQDKELAKMLQERERAKAKRAKERAKQKALAKKQLQHIQPDPNSILPDDSYSFPVDVLPQNSANLQRQSLNRSGSQERYEDDVNYSFPVDVLPRQENKRYNTTQKDFDVSKSGVDVKILNGLGPSDSYPSYNSSISDDVPPPVRPTQLDLR